MTAAKPDDVEDLVHLEVGGEKAIVTLDSPGNRNALSDRLVGQLLARLRSAVADDRVRVVVLTHTGPVFCAGADLKNSRIGSTSSADDFAGVLELLWTSPKPVLARLAGPVRGGGVGLVAACDLAVAADSVNFAFSEVRLGAIPAVISVPLRHRVPRGVLHRLFLTGEAFDAARARDMGLLSEVAPAAGLDDQVTRMVGMLLLGAPGALAAVKELTRPQASSLSNDLIAMQQLSARRFASDEGQEGVRAFNEKRHPAWATGRT
jgi:methylglutaconyl-CoA hydratase